MKRRVTGLLILILLSISLIGCSNEPAPEEEKETVNSEEHDKDDDKEVLDKDDDKDKEEKDSTQKEYIYLLLLETQVEKFGELTDHFGVLLNEFDLKTGVANTDTWGKDIRKKAVELARLAQQFSEHEPPEQLKEVFELQLKAFELYAECADSLPLQMENVDTDGMNESLELMEKSNVYQSMTLDMINEINE